jgi:hypothetical protein
MSFAQETFEAFQNLAIRHGFFDNANNKPNADVFMRRLEHWSLDFIFERHRFPNRPYDNVWVFQPVFRDEKKKKEFHARQVRTFILAVNSRTLAVRILSKQLNSKHFQFLKKPDAVEKIANNPAGSGFSLAGSPDELMNSMLRAIEQGTDKVGHRLSAGMKHVYGFNRAKKRQLYALVRGELGSWIHDRINAIADGFRAMIDREILEFARNFADKTNGYSRQTPLDIYNHLVAAPTSHLRKFRCSALTTLKPSGCLFDRDKTLWTAIDTGLPVHDALTKKLSIKRATVRHLLWPTSCPGAFFDEKQIEKYASYLDAIDTSLWPQSDSEARYFMLMADFAVAYGKVVLHEPERVMCGLAKALDRKEADCWKGLFYQRLHRQYALLRKARSRPSTIKDKDILRQAEHDLLGIEDMRFDVQRRVLMPLLLTEFERQGFEVLSLVTLTNLAFEASRKFWSFARPSEQVSASFYWHSERVKFQDRIQSIAYAPPNAHWKSLVNEPYDEIKIGDRKVVFVPLTSDSALREEGKAMNHCVGTYAINSLRDGYHVFSIRDEKDRRAATFCCKDIPPKNGKPQIAFVQCASHNDSAAPEWTVQAYTAFMKRVNTGELKIDWASILDSKAFFLAKEVHMTVGYDFHDEEQCRRMHTIFGPIFPRKIRSAAHNDPAALAALLGVENGITAFLSENGHQLEGLGIRRNPAQAVRPSQEFSASRHITEGNVHGL